jgi:lipoprotein-releasing system ATP-binding protein
MLEVHKLAKEYPMPGKQLLVLSEIDLILNPGDAASITGPSGSGKSTLLYILGALEPPTSGSVRLDGTDPFQLDEKSLAAFRNERIGFVFQDHHLLPQCTVLENVLIPTLVSPGDSSVQNRATHLLDRVGLSSRIHHLPRELSGGEKQRVALARALIKEPRLILCDEPTGNLDHDSADSVMDLLRELHKMQQSILIMVTHNLEIAQSFSLKYKLTDSHLLRV